MALRHPHAFLALSFASALTACGSPEPSPSTAKSNASGATSTSASASSKLTATSATAGGSLTEGAPSLKAGDTAPAFHLQGSDGKTHSLADHAGHEAVVVAWFPKAFTGG
jgi:hypothetical protein